MTSVFMFTWLVNAALACMGLLACGAIALKFFKQPADRLRIIQWTFAASVLSMVLVNVPLRSVVSLGTLSHGENAQIAGSPVETAQVSSARYADGDRPAGVAAARHSATAADREFPAVSQTSVSEDEPSGVTRRETASQPINVTLLAVRIICAVYVLGTLVFLIRWVQARMRLRRIVRNASLAPSAIQNELAQISGPTPDGVLLLVTDEVASPIMWGARRPVIVLPTDALRESYRSQLRYYLAHEWAHVKRGDYRMWQLATLLQFFLYYQPLFWWMRRQLATCMDQLADAAASDIGPSAADYAALLVELARRQLALAPRMTLSINDKQSALRQRVMFLLSAAAPPKATCPSATNLAIATTAILVGALLSTVRLEARTGSESSSAADIGIEQTPAMAGPAAAEKTREKDVPPANVAKAESISYTGHVIDAENGKPIEGAIVTVYRKLSRDPKTGGWRDLEKGDYKSAADGSYTFVLPPEQVAEPSLYLEVEAHHPNYAAKGRGGYSHAMIRKNLTLGEQPFYSEIKLWPGEAIAGVVVSPEGEPLPNVEVSMYSAAEKAAGIVRGSFDRTTTDAKGAFRIVPATPGDGVLWIRPEQFAPQALRIGDRRGDWGVLKMEKGKSVTGRILDAQGQPVTAHTIEADRRGDGEKADEFLRSNSVANGIRRVAETSPTGEFTLAALPDGDYQLEIQPKRDLQGYGGVDLKHVFVRQRISIGGAAAPAPLEIRALPHVMIRGTWFDSSGKPRAGSDGHLSGRLDGNSYFTRTTTPGNDGKFEVKAPHGLQRAQLYIITNEHSALRWRMSHEAPLRRNTRIDLGTIEDDISGIEVIRYTAPIVLVKPVDEEGRPVTECTPIIKYTRPDEGGDQMTAYTSGSHVSFEGQPDNRWRSSQALPDEPMAVSVKKDGYTTTEQQLSLKEGEERELVFVMKKAPKDEAKVGQEIKDAVDAALKK